MMSKERELLRRVLATQHTLCVQIAYEIEELLAQPEQDILRDKLNEEPIGEIALSGNTVSVGAPFPAVKWITGMMPAIGTKLYTAPPKPEQEPVFNFNLERMKLAVESPVSDVTVEGLTAKVKTNRMFYQEGYAQAELDLKREPLSDKEIAKGFLLTDVWHRYECFIAGVRFAEKAHGIGGEE